MNSIDRDRFLDLHAGSCGCWAVWFRGCTPATSRSAAAHAPFKALPRGAPDSGPRTARIACCAHNTFHRLVEEPLRELQVVLSALSVRYCVIMVLQVAHHRVGQRRRDRRSPIVTASETTIVTSCPRWPRYAPGGFPTVSFSSHVQAGRVRHARSAAFSSSSAQNNP